MNKKQIAWITALLIVTTLFIIAIIQFSLSEYLPLPGRSVNSRVYESFPAP
jgi:hypothetical protein